MAKAAAIFTHISYNFASVVALTLTRCIEFVVYLVRKTVLFMTKWVIHLEFRINHKFILICSDNEQVLPTIDADQAHALLSSGHGYIDVRCVLNGLTRVLEKLPWQKINWWVWNEMNLQDAGGLWQGPRTGCSQCSLLPVSHATRSVSSPCLLREGLFGLGVILIYSIFDLPFGEYVGSSLNLYSTLRILDHNLL
jgi:hypothetical protein